MKISNNATSEQEKKSVQLQIIGHSLGGIIAAEYAFHPEIWVEGTQVTKVITIASRLRNIEPPTETPHYPYCYDILITLDSLWSNILQNRGRVTLHTIHAEKDWLLPEASVLVGKCTAIIPNAGHTLVCSSPLTTEQILHWLYTPLALYDGIE